MKKSVLTASVLGAISTVISGVAFADINSSTYCKPGFYAGLQGGRGDTFYGTDDVLGPVVANNSGVSTYNSTYYYQNGSTNTTINSSTTFNTALTNRQIDDTGIAGRVYAGYQFNPYFATELGYTQFSKTDFSATANTTSSSTTPDNPNREINGNVLTTSSIQKYEGEITEHAIDLVAKGTLPLQYGFGVYAKAGMAYITANRYINTNGPISATYTITYTDPGIPTRVDTSSNEASLSTIYDKTYQAFVPVGGAGVNWTIPNTNFSLDASYTRFFASGGIKNASLAALGLEYKFA
jgi:hypothetical protein